MSTSTTADPYAGTAYRALCDAEDAVRRAAFLGSEGAICVDPAAALDAIDAACRALEDARRILAGARP